MIWEQASSSISSTRREIHCHRIALALPPLKEEGEIAHNQNPINTSIKQPQNISTILASAINTTPMHHWRSYYHLQTMLGIIIEWQTVLWFNLCGAWCRRLVIKWAPSPRGHKMNYIADILEDVSLPSSLSAAARPSSSSGTAQQSLPSTSAAPGMVNKSKFVIGGISIFG